jgi:hypothetical protein
VLIICFIKSSLVRIWTCKSSGLVLSFMNRYPVSLICPATLTIGDETGDRWPN